jgi:hypothetical protein
MNPIPSHIWEDDQLMCGTAPLEKTLHTTAGNVWEDSHFPFSEDEEIGLCQVVVDREFDQLISLKQCMDDIAEMRFCKYDPSAELALVWMKRPF